MTDIAPTEKIAVTIMEAVKLSSIGRDEIYRLLELPDFPAFKVGNKNLICVDGLRKWIARQAENKAGFKKRGA
jgi:predicted DNA-binding transcriptional regulator AlpA